MKRWTRWSIVLGFALGGFFDGILLHQILQWHHLLSLVPGLQDLRMQVLWDGYFHALMYVIAAVGLWGLWRAHRDVAGGWGSQLLGALLVGFGVWHVADSVLSHWMLGIHRIKLDSQTPMFWDLLWLLVFGVLPLLGGILLLRRRGGGRVELRGSRLAVLVVAGVTAAAAVWAMRYPPNQLLTTVAFRSGMSPDHVLVALAATGARLVWADPTMGVVVVDVPAERRWQFYRYGALLVSGSGGPAGCFNWSRA